MQVSLRPLVDADLDAIYEQMKDPESVRMAAFTPDDPADPHAFLGHMSRLHDDASVVQRVIEADGTIAGTIASFRIDDQTEVTYWIDRALWFLKRPGSDASASIVTSPAVAERRSR